MIIGHKYFSDKFITIITIVIILIIIVVIKLNQTYPKTLSFSEKILIAESYYLEEKNDDKRFIGMAIFNDGTIYKWDTEKNIPEFEKSTVQERKRWIFENGKKKFKRVTIKDLRTITILISNLKDESEKLSGQFESKGSKYIVVWNSKKEKIVLSKSGKNGTINKSENAELLILQINDLLKYTDKKGIL